MSNHQISGIAIEAVQLGDLVGAIPGIEFEVIVTYVAPEGIGPLALGVLQGRIEQAREAAERVCQSGSTPLPTSIETAIAEVLEARRRLGSLQSTGGTTKLAMSLRRELFAAIDDLGTLFDEEPSHA